MSFMLVGRCKLFASKLHEHCIQIKSGVLEKGKIIQCVKETKKKNPHDVYTIIKHLFLSLTNAGVKADVGSEDVTGREVNRVTGEEEMAAYRCFWLQL